MPVLKSSQPDRFNLPDHWLTRHVLALLAVAAGFLVRAGLARLAGGALPTYITFYPAVMLSALLGGLGPGLLATAAAAIGVDYFILPPAGSLAIASPADAISLAFFTGTCAFLSVVAELYRRARHQVQEREAQEYLRDYLEPPARRSKQGLLLNAGMVVSLGILAFAGWQSARSLRAVAETDQLVAHTHLVIQDLDRLLSSLKDEESGQRGYLLTGQESYLEPYQTALGEVRANLDALKQLIQNTNHQQSVTRVEDLIRDKEAELQQTIELRRSQGLPAALAVVSTDQGKSIMNNIRTQVADIQKSEEAVLQQRIADRNAQTGKTLQALLAGSILSFLLLITIFLFLKQENLRRAKAEADVRQHRDRLKDIVAARTAELARSNDQLKLEIDGHLQAKEALRQQGQWLHVTLSSIGDAVLATDTAGNITFLNPVAQSLTGWPESEVLGQPVQSVFRIINQHTRAPAEDIVARVLRDKQSVALANHTALLARDGREIPIEDSAAPIRNAAGAVTGVVLVFHDVTAKRRAQEALRESESRYRTIFDTMIEGFCIIEVIFDPRNNPVDYRFLEINPAFERQTGLHDAKGKLMRDLAPAHEPHWFDIYGKVALTGQPARFSNEARALGRWYDVSAYRVGPPESRRVAILFNDITEPKRAQLASAQLAAIVESSDDAILSKNLDGITTSWNAAAERLFGYRPDEIIGRPITMLLPPDRQDEETAIMARLQAGQRVEHFETVRLTKDGRSLEVSLTISPLRDPEGRIIGASKIIRDITERKQAEEALRRNEALLRFITDNTPDPIYLKDRESRMVMANAATLAAIGKPASAILGKPDTDFYDDPAIGSAIVETDRRIMESGQVQAVEEIIPSPGGPRIYLSTKSPAYDAEGRVTGLVGVSRDITERKRAEQQLRLLSTAFESAANGIAVTDRSGSILWVNPAFTRITGYSSAEAVGRNPRVLKSGKHPPEFYTQLWSTILKGEPWHGELVNRRKDASLYTEEMTITPVRSQGAEISHFVAIKQNITARKHAERRTELLAETAARLLSSDEPQQIVEELCARVLEFLDCQVFFNFLADDKQHRLHLNACAGIPKSEAAKIEWLDYGVAVSGCAARDVTRIVAGNIQESSDPQTAPLKSFGVQAYACHPLIVADRLLGTLSFGARNRKDFTDEELSFMKAVSDLVATAIERKRTQNVLQLTAEEAKRSNRDLEQFAYIASHDLQEPLRAVGGYVKLLQRRFPENMDPKAIQYINGAAEGADRMERLITDLLAFSRVGTHGGAFSSASLDAILNEALRNLKTSIETAQVKITRDPLPSLRVDSTQIMQIFQNLIGNAIKFHSERPPEIHIGAQHEPDRWVITVRDNGIGIEPQYFDRIFQIFQRLHTRAHYPGTGIGLAICKKMVERHGGAIWVQSQPGQGSAFHFSLPDTPSTN